MGTRLILVEGIPGSGKTTAAKHVETLVNAWGFPCRAYVEGGENPADLAWNAFMTVEKMNELMASFPLHAASIQKAAAIQGGHAVVPSLSFLKHDDPLYAEMEACEVYDGRVDELTFQTLHQNRWTNFAKSSSGEETMFVLECALLQNHFNEYCLFHKWKPERIENAVNRLLDTVAALRPCLIYLAPSDVNDCIQTVAKERVWPGGSWAERVTQYLLNSPYGIDQSWTRENAMVDYFAYRQAQEIQMLSKLHARTRIIRYGTGHWDVKMEGIHEALQNWLAS